MELNSFSFFFLHFTIFPDSDSEWNHMHVNVIVWYSFFFRKWLPTYENLLSTYSNLKRFRIGLYVHCFFSFSSHLFWQCNAQICIFPWQPNRIWPLTGENYREYFRKSSSSLLSIAIWESTKSKFSFLAFTNNQNSIICGIFDMLTSLPFVA